MESHEPQASSYLPTDQPGQNAPAPGGPQQQADGGSNRGGGIFPPAAVVPIGSQGPHPPIPEDEARERRTECRDRWRLFVEVMALFVGIAGIIGLILTLRQAREALILDQRPWVFSKDPMLVSLQSNVPITTFMNFVNTGRSPAFIIESSVMLRTVDSSGLPVIPEYEAPEPQNYVLSPVAPHPYRHITYKGLAPQNLAAVMNETFKLYIYGYVRYRDSQGDEHKTGFIVVYNPKQRTLDHSPQPNYTYAD